METATRQLRVSDLTALQRTLELAYGKPIVAIVEDALGKHKSRRGAARGLGVTHSCLNGWIRQLGIEADKVIARAILAEVA